MAKRKTKEEVMAEAGIAPTLPTSETRTFLAKKVAGRDGSGPCTITNKNIMMPNGDIAAPGDTFDPETEKMTPIRLRQLVAGKYVTDPKDDSIFERLAKLVGKKTRPKPEPEPEKTTKIEQPTTTKVQQGHAAG